MGIAFPTKLVRLIRDTVSILRQTLHLPHNRTRSQILATKKTFDEKEIQDLRSIVIGEAYSLPTDQIRDFSGELQELPRIPQDAIDLWNTHGASMMSRRDLTTLYALVRAHKPKICVETGTGAGSASRSILFAMDKNNKGALFSIDMAGSHANEIGDLVPQQSRERWKLYLQEDAPLLPAVLDDLNPIDFFLHDSNHSYHHMNWEFELAWSHLQPGGCLASHDVVATSSFADFQSANTSEIASAGMIGNIGFIIKGTDR